VELRLLLGHVEVSVLEVHVHCCIDIISIVTGLQSGSYVVVSCGKAGACMF
jgi:hypothetical protein